MYGTYPLGGGGMDGTYARVGGSVEGTYHRGAVCTLRRGVPRVLNLGRVVVPTVQILNGPILLYLA